jgi:hypothetical protein
MSRSPDTVSAHSPILPCFLSFAHHGQLLAHCVQSWRHYQKCCSFLHTLTGVAVIFLHYVTNCPLWVTFCHDGSWPFPTLLSVATHAAMLSKIVCSLGLYLVLRHNVLCNPAMLSTFAHTFEYGDLLHHSVVSTPSVGQCGQRFDSMAGVLATYFRVWPVFWTVWPIQRHYYSIALFFDMMARSRTTLW